MIYEYYSYIDNLKSDLLTIDGSYYCLLLKNILDFQNIEESTIKL